MMKRSKIFWIFEAVALTSLMYSCALTTNSNVEPVGSNPSVAYVNDVKPIVDNYCITCHSGGNPSAGLTLTSYENVVEAAKTRGLLNRINDYQNPMPQGGLMSKDLRKTIELWAEQGYQKERSASEGDTLNQSYEFTPPTIVPVDINEKGFDLLEKMQGHWVGKMNLMGQNIPWFAFDYRAISESHVHGIFEGGTMGNLFTSFFVTEFNGRRTIMARNGGLLNGIYRTSYFVLDEVRYTSGESYFRLIDAYGGEGIMWMELTFKGDELFFNSYTSRFGTFPKPKKHMQFQGTKMHEELAQAAAQATGFPKNTIALDFSGGLPDPDWGDIGPITSASYIWESTKLSLSELAKLAKDPYPIGTIPYLSQLSIELEKSSEIQEDKVLVYLSMEPLTDENGKMYAEFGYIEEDRFNGVLMFPELINTQNEFTFTYLHPGEYYLTVVADKDASGYISKSDVSSVSKKIVIPKNAEITQKVSW